MPIIMNINIAVSPATAKSPNLNQRQYFRIYGIVDTPAYAFSPIRTHIACKVHHRYYIIILSCTCVQVYHIHWCTYYIIYPPSCMYVLYMFIHIHKHYSCTLYIESQVHKNHMFSKYVCILVSVTHSVVIYT